MQQRTPMQKSHESQYHQLVEANSLEDILNVIASVDNGRIGLYTLAMRKIARGVKTQTNRSLFSDERYKKLKAIVLDAIPELNEQEMCDVLFWLRVLYESYSNLEWLGQVTLHRLEQRISELALRDRFKLSQLINVFLDSAMLRIDTSEVEEIVCQAMEGENFRLNMVEVHILLSGFYLVFDKEKERMLKAYYAMVRQQGVLSTTDTVLLLMTLQTLCESEAAEDYADIRPFQRLIIDTLNTRMKTLNEEDIDRLFRTLTNYPEVTQLCQDMIPKIEELLDPNSTINPKSFAIITEFLVSLHESGIREWPSAKDLMPSWLQTWSNKKLLTDALFSHMLSVLVKVGASLNDSTVGQFISLWKDLPLSLDSTLFLIIIASRAPKSFSHFLTFAASELISQSKCPSIREVFRVIFYLRKESSKHEEVKQFEKWCWSFATSITTCKCQDPNNLYYGLEYQVVLKPLLVEALRVPFSPLLLKYALSALSLYPELSTALIRSQLDRASAGDIEEALLPAVHKYEFGPVVRVMRQYGTAKISPEGVLRLAKYAKGTVTREDCQNYLQLLAAVPGDYYQSRQLTCLWPTLLSIIVKAEIAAPRNFAKGVFDAAMDDCRKGGQWELRKATSVMRFLTQSGALTKEEEETSADILATAQELTPTLPCPFSLSEATSHLSSLVASPSPDALSSFLSSISSSLPYISIDDQLTILTRVYREPSGYPDAVLHPLSSLIEDHWTRNNVLLSTQHLLQLLMLNSRSERFHEGLSRIAAVRLAEQFSTLRLTDKAKLLCGLAIPDKSVDELMTTTVTAILKSTLDTSVMGSQVLQAFHVSNRIEHPLHLEFASSYVNSLENKFAAEYFNSMQAVPYLIRASMVTPTVARLGTQFFPRDITCAGFARKLALWTYFHTAGATQFPCDPAALAAEFRCNPDFAHPLLAGISNSMPGEVELFPQSLPVPVPLYVKHAQTGVWLHSRRLFCPTGASLRGDYAWYSSLAAKHLPRFSALPTLHNGNLAAVVRALRHLKA